MPQRRNPACCRTRRQGVDHIPAKEERSLRAEQTVSEMVVESLARQAEALSEVSGQSLEEAFGEVLKTPAGRRLGELAEGPHRHQRAAEWQTGLIAAREARRKAHLRSSIPEGGHHERGEGRYSGLARLEA
jgi:hypothetical protein